MFRNMQAEIIFLNPDDLTPATAKLIESDFDVEFLDDWFDDDGPAVWIYARTVSDLDPSSFFDFVKALIEPVGGDVVQAGYAWSSRGAPAS
jgi:hypothetical protein